MTKDEKEHYFKLGISRGKEMFSMMDFFGGFAVGVLIHLLIIHL